MFTNTVTRRELLRFGTLLAGSIAAGCAANPVTGQLQLMLVSEDTEIQLDRMHAPHQLSSDYGIIQDRTLNAYIQETGRRLVGVTHRRHMPYSFSCVNAVYINAYAFPGGTIAVTRGMLLKLHNEAELASVLGHELGHVNARHTAQQMSRGVLIQAIVGGIAAAAGMRSDGMGQLAADLGMLGAGALLASYSRDHERQADALGMEYMVKAGYNAEGFVGLMQMLNAISKQQDNAVTILFSTHPMSDERYRTACNMAQRYATARNNPLHRERYMDNTVRLRACASAIQAFQKAEEELGQRRFTAAEALIKQGLHHVPEDYAGLLLMAKCHIAQHQFARARDAAERAKAVYPSEAHAYYVSGFSKIKIQQYESGYQDFIQYDRILPGNPTTTFFKGYALEGMHRIPEAAEQYQRYLRVVQEGEKAQYAYRRLVEWGYVRH